MASSRWQLLCRLSCRWTLGPGHFVPATVVVASVDERKPGDNHLEKLHNQSLILMEHRRE